ncbi:MAG: AMP-binding protein [Burkholderiaceae bacterium]
MVSEDLVHAMEADDALRESFFARVKMFFSAGAGMPNSVADGLYRLGEMSCGTRVGLYSGLGMTETAPFALGPSIVGELPGAIGCPAPGMTIKLVPNGGKLEVRYQGPGVMPGYWRAPQANAEAFDDEGYFVSGDAIRLVDPERPELGFAFDGRVAEDFKLLTGTWVSVGPLRTRALAEGSPYVQDVVVAGHDRDSVGLLVFPNYEACARLGGLPAGATPAQVVAAPAVSEFFQGFVNRMHAAGTGASSRIACALLMTEPAAIDRGEVTDKGSLNQRAVLGNRQASVERLYSDADDVVRPAA